MTRGERRTALVKRWAAKISVAQIGRASVMKYRPRKNSFSPNGPTWTPTPPDQPPDKPGQTLEQPQRANQQPPRRGIAEPSAKAVEIQPHTMPLWLRRIQSSRMPSRLLRANGGAGAVWRNWTHAQLLAGPVMRFSQIGPPVLAAGGYFAGATSLAGVLPSWSRKTDHSSEDLASPFCSGR